jgi:hypothetical protein
VCSFLRDRHDEVRKKPLPSFQNKGAVRGSSHRQPVGRSVDAV